MSAGVSEFNKVAINAYHSITSAEKAISQSSVVHTHTMSAI